jgi:dTDP-4-dehydrorhamnose reductase
MRILVTGAAGRLGGVTQRLLTECGHDVQGVDKEQFDITDFQATRAFVADAAPQVVIHAAAWTDVEGCARDPERARQINGYGAQNVALAAAEIDAAVVHISSNEVFDGGRGRPYYEYDPPGPVNPYGASKLTGERAVAAVNRRHYIVRTAWLFAHGGGNFIHAILNAAQSGKRLRVVTDEIANPTYNDDLAGALATLIETGRYGSYHLTNEGWCSRYAFARYVLDRAGLVDCDIEPITSREWARASIPPAYTALANVAGAMIGLRLRPWQAAVDAFLEREGLV